MSSDTAVILFSKDRAMQLDAAIRSCRAQCTDLLSVEKFIIFKTTSKIHANQYKQLQDENQDFVCMEETQVIQQVSAIISHFTYISFHCDDNMYIRPFSFSKGIQILSKNKSILGHSFRLGRNVKYSYTRNSPEPQPIFTDLGQKVLRFNWTTMKPRGFGYPFEVSASIYRCQHILPLILNCSNCTIGGIETHLMNSRKKFLVSCPLFTCEELSSVISIPINTVGAVPNISGQKYNYPIEDLARKFSKNFRIDTDQFNNHTSETTHVELKFSFERKPNERME